MPGSPTRPTRRRTLATCVVLVVALVAGLFAVPSSAEDPAPEPLPPWTFERVSLAGDGGEPDGDSYDPELSADGGHVVFESTASNLGSTGMPIGNGGNVVAVDLATGDVEAVSIDTGGGRLAYPNAADVSGDGAVVVMSSGFSGTNRVIVRDRSSGTSASIAPFQPARAPAISDAGDRVVLLQADADLDDEDLRQTVWLWDGVDGTIRPLVQLTSHADRSAAPTISGDGSTAAFEVSVAGAPEVRVVDVNVLGEEVPAAEVVGGARLPSLSADGLLVAYAKRDPVSRLDAVHVLDRATGTDRVVVELPEFVNASEVDLSADGSTVGLIVQRLGSSELWVSDVATGRTEVLTEVEDSYGRIDVGADGRTVAFSTSVNGIVPGDDNRMADVFLARRTGALGPAWPVGASLAVDATGSTFATVRWPEAHDDLAVDHYVVRLDGATVAVLAASARDHTLTGLTPDTPYAVEVVAVDGAGNASTPLTADLYTNPPAEPGTAPLSVIGGAGGTAILQWDAAPGAEGYRVLRAVGPDAALEPVADVDAGTLGYEDAGLAAGVEHRYRVDALAGGDAMPHTVEATYVTADVAIESVTWQGRNVLGTPLSVTVVGDSGWQGHLEVRYLTWYGAGGELLDAPEPATAEVPLAESATEPGRYLGAFTLDDGVAEVSGITAVLGDGAGAEARADAGRLPLAVRGALRVVIDAPEGSLPGARAVLDGTAQAAIAGGATWDVPSVAPGARTVRVLSARGTELGAATVAAVGGRRIDLTVSPGFPAALTVRVLDPDGQALEGAAVTFLAGGEILGQVTSDEVGLAALTGERLAGDVVEVQVQPPARRLLQSATVEATLEPGDNVVDVDLPGRPVGVLTGTVTLGDGVPAVGARVVLSQVDEGGLGWSFADVTDADGRYEIAGIAGPGTVVVGYSADPPHRAGSVDLDAEPTVLDVSLARPDRYRLQLTVLTRTADDPTWRPVEISQSTGYQLGLQVLVNGDWRSGVGGDSVLVDAEAGDEATVCANAWKAGMAQTCVTTPLGDARVIPVELRLESVAAVRGAVVGADGQPLPASNTLSAVVQPLDEPGSARSYRVLEGRFDVAVARPGRYLVSIIASNLQGTASQSASVEVDLAAGEVLDVGTISVATSQWTRTSTLTASRGTILPGTTVELRAALEPLSATTVSGMEARFAIPAGTEVVAGSVLVDGVPVDGIVDGAQLRVALGDRAWNFGSRPVVVRYRLLAVDVAPGTVVAPSVQVRSLRGSTEVVEPAASTAVRIAGVTLLAPAQSATREVQLSGQAPAGAVVEIVDGTTPVGQAIASPGGYWRLAATLPDLGSGFEHALVASSELDGQPLTSAVVTVVVDERLPVLEHVALSQEGNRVVGWDPGDGVARFPFVVESGPLELELRFGGRGTATDVRGVIGGISAPAQALGGGVFQSTLPMTHQLLGAVRAEYDAVPAMATADDIPVLDEGRVRSAVPAPLSDFAGTTVTEDHDEANGIRRAHITSAVPSLGDTAEMRTTLSIQRGLAYEPTAADLATSTRIGVPFYGLDWSVTASGDDLTVEVAGYVPEELLGTPDQAPATFGAAALGVARAGFQLAFSGGQTLDSLYTAATTGDKYERLNNLLDWVNGNCDDPGTSSMLVDQLERLNVEALAADALHAGLMVAGLAAAPATFGIGTLGIWAVTFVMDKAVDFAIDKQIGDVVDMAKDLCRDDDEQDPRFPPDPNDPDQRDPSDPLGVPTWIYDPSGYVFEAVPSNRLEGVTATLTYSPTPDGPFEVWDADWYGQSNPLVTDAEGRYGWDVPEGFWQVVYTAAGYETARSEVLEVLPPHFDVNVGMRSTAAPEVTSASAVAGVRSAVSVEFSRYMRLDTGERITVVDAAGEPVAGIVIGADVESGPGGAFARRFELVTFEPLPVGEVLTVAVEELATSYADRPMLAPYSTEVVVADVDEAAPTVAATVTPAPGAGGWHAGPATVELTAADEGGSGVAELRWTLEGAQTGSGSAPGAAASVVVSVEGETTVRFMAVDAAGNESAEGTAVVRVDGSRPVVSIASPTEGARFRRGEPVTVDFGCDDALSGVASCEGSVADGSPLPTGTPGTHEVTVTATDVAGNTATATVTYEVTADDPLVLLDGVIATVRSYGLSRIRTAGLLAPLHLARLGIVVGRPPMACANLQLFDGVVDAYAAKRWLAAPQAAELHAGAAAVRTALAC